MEVLPAPVIVERLVFYNALFPARDRVAKAPCQILAQWFYQLGWHHLCCVLPAESGAADALPKQTSGII
ncbi:MAG: hypothetical protein CSA33_04645 [Desulfobulbus propionicus]|nr:MAG: hypothetical protein CSA33_04645 [Desulfobulbus propionicus]